MPNHITNYVLIQGSETQIADLIKKCKVDDNDFDFDGIIPMPKELLETCSPNDVVETQEEADKLNAEWKKTMGDFQPDQNTKAITKEEAQRRELVYGATNWYDFACNKWGTKWGAYEVEIIDKDDDGKYLYLSFQTAWSPPRAIFKELEVFGYKVSAVAVQEGDEGYDTYGDEVWNYFDIEQRIDVMFEGVN